jgi:hypothetical protein
LGERRRRGIAAGMAATGANGRSTKRNHLVKSFDIEEGKEEKKIIIGKF